MKRALSRCRSLLCLGVPLLVGGCSDDANEERPDAAVATDAGALGNDGATLSDGSIEASSVTVTGPIGGGLGKPFTASSLDLTARGYSEKEFFFAGDANAYALQGAMTMDGRWTLTTASKQPYKSRLLVRRPLDPAEFNGTVIVEWLNVSGGADGDPGFMYNAQEILREGYAWVGVSAQMTGVQGGGFSLLPGVGTPLKQYDPERYGSLSHPGDSYSFDIFTRAAQIVRGLGGLDVLEGLVAQRLMAYGESQSAIRMVSYVNGVQPLAKAFDGFFIHSRAASGVEFTDDAGLMFGATPAHIREDLTVPVFQFQTETDVFGTFAYLAARQADSARLRTWEVTGTAHADAYILNFNGGSRSFFCGGVNDGPQHFVIKAALHALNLWMRDGSAPVVGAPLLADASGKPAIDAHGNTLGGVRTPAVDVPISTLSGLAPGGADNVICSLFGQSIPFMGDKLLTLYPSHEDYVAKVRDAAQKAQQAQFVLEPEAQAIIAAAEAAAIPN